MREISFIGRKFDDSEMIYGHLIIDDISGYYYIEPFDNSKSFRVHKKTVGQFTGKCDCDGLKIYEGDIVESPHQEKCIVFFSAQFAAFQANANGADVEVSNRITIWHGGEFEFCKHIGNIHEL